MKGLSCFWCKCLAESDIVSAKAKDFADTEMPPYRGLTKPGPLSQDIYCKQPSGIISTYASDLSVEVSVTKSVLTHA